MEEVIVVEVTELLEIVDVGFTLGFKPFRGWLVVSRDEGRRGMNGVMVVVGGRIVVRASGTSDGVVERLIVELMAGVTIGVVGGGGGGGGGVFTDVEIEVTATIGGVGKAVIVVDVGRAAAVVVVDMAGAVVDVVKAVEVVDWSPRDAVLLWPNGKRGWPKSCPRIPSSSLVLLLSLSLLTRGRPS